MGNSNTNKNNAAMSEGQHLNWMGGISYDINDPLVQLRIIASSCFFGEPQYYHTDEKEEKSRKYFQSDPMMRPLESIYYGQILQELKDHLAVHLQTIDPVEWRDKTPAKMMEDAIDKAIAHDVEAALVLAGNLRQHDHIRTTPQIIMVRAANSTQVKGTNLIRKYAPQIIRRADELSTQLAYQLSAFGKPIPSRLKRAWADKLETLDEYALAKYRQENHVVSLWDVVNIAHPKATPALTALMKGGLSLAGKTWEAITSEKGSTKEAWEESIDVMGHMALLRNLSNLEQAGIAPDVFIEKLKAGVKGGKQLPFRYWSAYAKTKANGASPITLDAIEECLMLSMEDLPYFDGRVMSLTDNSGSAQRTFTSKYGTVAINQIANLTGVITGMISKEGYIGVFGDRLDVMPIRKKSSVFDQTEETNKKGSNIGGGTENGIWLFWDNAIKQKEHWDYVFIYSDMQAGHGGLYGLNSADYHQYQWPLDKNNIDIPSLIDTYRKEVNPNVLVFCVQIAGYKDTIVPEFYNRTYIMGGWSDGVLQFAGYMANMNSQKS